MVLLIMKNMWEKSRQEGAHRENYAKMLPVTMSDVITNYNFLHNYLGFKNSYNECVVFIIKK